MKIPVKLLKLGIIAICVLFVVFSYLLCKLFPTEFKFRDFIPYQCWLTGIVVFCIILPAKVGTIFDE
jgi:hypothetical protein